MTDRQRPSGAPWPLDEHAPPEMPEPTTNGRHATNAGPFRAGSGGPPDVDTAPDDPEAASAAWAGVLAGQETDRQNRYDEHEQRIRRARRKAEVEEELNPPDAEHRRVRLTPASAIPSKAMRWMWQGRMPVGELALVPGREGVGKALALDTPILTRRGWLTMAEVKAGDFVRHPSGGWTEVLGATETMTDRRCFEVVFSDGASIVADADHLWRTETLNARERRKGERPAVVTTARIASTLHARDGHCLNHAVPTCEPLHGKDARLPVAPYVLGAWLGDGHSDGARITSADPEIVDHIRAAGEPCRPLGGLLYSLSDGRKLGRHADQSHTLPVRLRALGVLGAKHIPEVYLNASVEQRVALLQGLMDTDGTIGANGRCEFSVCSRRLAEDVHELLLGLGVKVALLSGPAKLKGRTVGTRWRLSFRTNLPAFRLSRKAQRLKPTTSRRHRLRYITETRPTESVPVRCIQVSAGDGMYLAGRNLVPTHNSTFLAWLTAQLTNGELPGVWFGKPRAVLYAAMEDSWAHTIKPRMLAAGANLDLVYRVDVEMVDGRAAKLSLPVDTAKLREHALDVGAAALFCDPIISVLSDKINTFKAQELRGALEPLKIIAEQADMGIVGLVHFNKGKDNDVLTAISGSRAWTEVARSVVAIARDPDADEYTCVVSQVKNNLGRLDLDNEAYTIRSVIVETDDGGQTDVGCLAWTSKNYGKSVEDIINPTKEKKRSELHEQIIEFVTEQEAETGAGVPANVISQRFGGMATVANIRQVLVRLTKDGALKRVGYGLYGAGDARPCAGGCGQMLAAGENFCRSCRRKLDQQSGTWSSNDGLF